MKSVLEEIREKNLKIDKSKWKSVKFGQVAFQKKDSIDRDNTDVKFYVRGEHMESEDLHIRQWGELADEYLGPAFIRRFESGDILYGSRRTYLKKVAVAHFDGITSNTTFVINANEELIIKNLLPFVMLSKGFTQHSIKNSKGSVNPYINWKDIANYEFLLPPKDQQSRLAELLWAADEVIGFDYKMLSQTKELLTSVRDNEVCNPMYRRTSASEVIHSITAGKSVNGTNIPVNNGTKGVLKVSAVGPNGFDADENKTLSNQGDFLDKFKVGSGDLLITRANTTELVGRVCLVDNDYSNLMLCDKTLRLNVDHTKCYKVFLKEALSSKEVRKQIEGSATGTGGAMKNISQSEIMTLQIPLPDIQDQQNIVSRLTSLYNTIDRINSKIDHSKQLQKSLINQIF